MHTSHRNLSSPNITFTSDNRKTHLPRLNELRKVLASAEKKSRSGTQSNASHYTESASPDDRKPNFQVVSGEGIFTHENDASDRDAMSEVDSVVTIELPDHPNDVADMCTKALTVLICEYVPSYDVPNPAAIRPRTVLIYYLQVSKPESGKSISIALPSDIVRDLEPTESYRKLEEQVKHQNHENCRLHRRVSSIYESAPTSHTKPRRSARYKEMESEWTSPGEGEENGSFLMPGREGTNGTRS
ncbi:hypothetical protein AAWM_07236 [Aspergillus awamori]|uniref:Uncharacterized protein n=1 Tax=Aspergillus awamori TaxID=105351 RepID=A0A401KYN8_ASPAW|nr:hypothetical protein AAWM_07236 [Aspergillus awamori]GLA21781.1 hypothetical protein AnigIFM62618_001337 [Aspergillus niger]